MVHPFDKIGPNSFVEAVILYGIDVAKPGFSHSARLQRWARKRTAAMRKLCRR
jgi:hypothetical protein